MCDIGSFIFGIIILVRGVCPLPGNREVRGTAAYIVGGLLTAALPLAMVFAIVMIWDDLAAGNELTPEAETQLMLYYLGVVVALVLAATVFAFANAQPRQEKRRRRRHDDYDDYDDDYDDDRTDERWDDDNRRDRRR